MGLPDGAAVREVLWRQAGLVRTQVDLESAVATLAAWRDAVCDARDASPDDRGLQRLESLTTVGFLIAHAALRREESRGGHYRSDFPRRDDLHWQAHFADVQRD